MTGAPRVLVLRALGLGDLLTVVPALRAVRRAFPRHHLQLATPEALAPLAQLTGAVDEVVDARPLAPLPAATHCADVAVNLHGAGPESHRILLATRPGRLVALACPGIPAGGDGPAPRDDRRLHERARWCRMLAARGVAADPDDLELAPPPPAPPAVPGATVIHPGAASPARRWPVERWARVAAEERAGGRRVLVTGGEDERLLCARLARLAGIPAADVLAGHTDLEALCRTVAAAGLVLCGDTGVAHLASAFARPSVVLFGPTPPARWGPPERPWHRVLWSGRTGDPHAQALDPGLARIGVDEVVDAVAALRRRLPATASSG